VRKEGEMMND